MTLYSVRMRASSDGRHISGAEHIVTPGLIPHAANALTKRALSHPKGQAADIRITAERLNDSEVLRIAALPVENETTKGPEEAQRVICQRLGDYTPHAESIWQALVEVRDMRGAMLVNALTGQRLDPDRQRGVRVSHMDAAGGDQVGTKSPAKEALILASKVVAHPEVLAEVCISDDPDYTTGYFADKGGYVRIPNIKPSGSNQGGRVFICTGENVEGVVNYLESIPVLVEGCRE